MRMSRYQENVARKTGGARAAGNVETAGRVVNLAVRALTAFIGLMLLAACGRPSRPAPIEPGPGDWHTVLGGADRAGYADELAPEDNVGVTWRIRTGRGLLAPLIVRQGVLLAATSDAQITALATEDGAHYWTRGFEGTIRGGVVAAGGRVFVTTERRSGKAYALELRDGETIWERTVGSSPFTPLLNGDTVVIATEGGNVFALDAATGGELWQTPLPGAAETTVVSHDGSLLVATATDTLFRLDRSTGRISARHPLPASVSAPPALKENTLVLPLYNGQLMALELPQLDIVWSDSLGAPILAAPAVSPDGSVYALTADATVWRVPDGSDRAEEVVALGGAARGSLMLVRDRIIVGRLDGTLFLLRMDGSVIWTKELDESIVAPATVTGGAVYVPLLRGGIVKLR